ncbi:5379_t:CDS:1, partial [Racocetra fulgida]
PWTSKEELRKVVYQAISTASNIYAEDFAYLEKLGQIPPQVSFYKYELKTT